MASSSSTQNRSMSDSPLSPRTLEFEEKLKDFFEFQATILDNVVWNHRVDDRITRLLKSICVPWDLSENQSKPVFDTIQVDGISLQPLDPADRDILIRLAQPASLGRGSETVFDETVHKALEIPADRLVVDKKQIDLILNAIEKTWYNYKFDAKLYKMLIYQETGKFQIHQDTVHDSKHIATLFVRLHQAEIGGNLFVGDHRLSTSGWWAFFTNCWYQVKEVKKGCYIVLQSRVRRVDDQINKGQNLSDMYWRECNWSFAKFMPPMDSRWLENKILHTVVENRIKEELRSLWTPDSKEDFGLLLGHDYMEFSAIRLKGTDLMLYQIVQEMEEIESELVHVSVKVTEHFCMPTWQLIISPILPREDVKPIIVLPSLQYERYTNLVYQRRIEHARSYPAIETVLALVLVMKKKSDNEMN